jgi:hypothetical protein
VTSATRKAKSETRKAKGQEQTNSAFRFPLFALLFSLLLMSGCSAAGVLAYKLAGPPKVEAKYVPDKTAPMLVLVENYKNPSATQAHAELLSAYLAEDLTANDVAPLVPEEKLRELRDARPADFQQMSVASLARATGAEQVLYVQLHDANVAPLQGTDSLQGSAHATVKMIDGKTGQTLWPLDSETGYPVAARTQLGTDGGTDPMDVRQRMYRDLALQIGRLLHKWQPDDGRPQE